VTTVVANIVWASIAGIAIALAIAAAVAVIIRLQRPSAATRYALWFVALATCALAPLAIVGTMLVRGGGTTAQLASTAPMRTASAARADDDNALRRGGDDANTGTNASRPVAAPRRTARCARSAV